ncbi:MAG: tyrosine--tRNA ligase [Alphaproteobacteria bacterium]|nr:tyrosine--tRNA ligase [Alphaproteobacteria bacterium]
MHVLDILEARGLLKQTTDRDALAAALSGGPLVIYAGFDPTGDSLHVGHLMPVLSLAWLQRAGHRVLVILGGGTARVGDPTGKDKTRELITAEQIASNLESMRPQFGRFLRLEDAPGEGLGGADIHGVTFIDNAEWLMEWGYVDFLREVGSHFSVNRMLTAEGTKQRLDRNQGLSFIEFNYHLLQSYDFLHLFRERGCTVQVGGDDQWFHIVGGADLIRRAAGGHAFGMTVPLLQTADGKKMGKTESGAVWLDRDKLCPYDFFQYWLNVHDDDVEKLLKLYTWLELDVIAELCRAEGQGLREAKRVLAREATRIVHGDDDAADADYVSRVLFGKGELSADDRARIVRVLGSSGTFPHTAMALPAPWEDCAVAADLCASKGEARRLVKQGGARTWNDRVDDPLAPVTEPSVLWAGKKKAALITAG